MNYILFDGPQRDQLLPFTFTRPVADIRMGILTIREKWEIHLDSTTSTLTEEYLSKKYPMVEMEENVMINASYLPTKGLVKKIKSLTENQAVFDGEDVVAFYVKETQDEVDFSIYKKKICPKEAIFKIGHTWDIFLKNGQALQDDFNFLTAGRESEPIPEGTRCMRPENIFIEPGAVVNFAILNAESGPIYLAKNSEVMENTVIRGPFALGENATVKIGAKIYGATTVGPHCKVGGEITNSVLMGYSNKGHDGYLGNSVLGEWCNLGADTNNSNLKNNYASVKLWDYESESFAQTGLQFCGLMMGDHSKCSINTMFNTGTVVGVSANIFGSGFPPNFVPSFSWGGSGGFTTYKTDKAFETAKRVMERRDLDFGNIEREIMEYIFSETARYRKD